MKTYLRCISGWLAVTCLLLGLIPFSAAAEDTVESVTWVQPPTKTAYYYGERPDITGGVLRFQFADGTCEDAVIEGTMFRPTVTVSRLNGTQPVQSITPDAMNGSAISFTVLGQTVSCTVEVAAAPTQWELAVDDCHALTLTVDGETMPIRSFSGFSGTYSSDGSYDIVGTLYTDQAAFLAYVCKTAEGALTVSLGHDYYDIGVVAVSNPVYDDLFFAALDQADKAIYSLSAYRGAVDRFDGTVSAENIDDLFRFAVWHYSPYPQMVGSMLDYFEIDVSYAQHLMKTTFGVDFDATQSRYYVAQENTLHLPKTSDGATAHSSKIAPVYRDGLWWVETYSTDGQVFTFTMNDEYTLTAFEVCQSGDVTGDRRVSTADARTLLLNVIGTPTLSRAATLAGDLDRDGHLRSSDVRAILLAVVNAS